MKKIIKDILAKENQPIKSFEDLDKLKNDNTVLVVYFGDHKK